MPHILLLKVGGAPLDVSRHYKTVMTDAVMATLLIANAKLHLGMDLSDITETGIEGWRAVLAYATKTRHFTVQNLRDGTHTLSTLPNPAVYSYGMTLDADGIAVDVANEGLAPVTGARLECAAGVADDLAAYDTDDEVFTKFGEALIPVLNRDAHAHLHISWHPSAAGYWPVQCQISMATAAANGYSGNSTAVKVFVVPPRT